MALPPGKEKRRFFDGFKMFLVALSFSFICKALGGVIMKSSITQIERRFDIPSSLAGVIDGGFEIGNLLVIVFVSYFGSKLNRPKLIGIGCFIMGLGSIVTALPHFFMGHYRYSTESNTNSLVNSTLTCLVNQTSAFTETSPKIVENGCEKEAKSYMWIYVLMGNMLRGIGETPIGPLGISYIDDFAKEGKSSVYLGTLNTVAMIGPIIGFVMSSLFARLYVDIGFVDLSSIRITPKDTRWVGAWWLGFLVSGLLSIICSLPFFFLPKNPYKSQKEHTGSTSLHMLKIKEEKTPMTNSTKPNQHAAVNMASFLQSMKKILTNRLYVLYMVLTLLHISSFIGSFTYLFKYVEQQYGQSASQANFLLGIITIPTMASGMFLGGYLIKKLKLTMVGIGKFAFFTCFVSFIFLLSYYPLICENKAVAGLTLTYDGITPVESHVEIPLSSCNSDCSCKDHQWEPICGENGVTYISPCLAGCKSMNVNKTPNNTVFYECSCIKVSDFQHSNNTAHLGECPRSNECNKKYYFYIGVQVLNTFFAALGTTSFILLLVRNVEPELKSLAMGFHALIIRGLGGILAPIYFGALIDKTCLKWSFNSCGARGACRVYNSTFFGMIYLGLSAILKFLALILYIVFIFAMKRKYEREDSKHQDKNGKESNEANSEPVNNNGYYSVPSASTNDETHI